MVKSKIISNDGATILLALLFFVMCSVAGAIIIGAGSSASGRVANLINQEQAYYTVSSTAQVIRDDATDNEFTIIRNGSNTSYGISNDKGIGPWLSKAAEIVTTTKKSFSDDNVTLEVSNNDVADFSKVAGQFVMNKDYSVNITLQQVDDSGKKDDAYTCKIVIKADVDDTNPSLMTVIWNRGVIGK